MKQNKEKHPCQVIIVSTDGMIEFPVDWTRNPVHLNVALVHDFSSIEDLQSETDLDKLGTSCCDWITDSDTNLLLFKNKEVLIKFKENLPNHRCKARMATESDRKCYNL